ncbi:MAG: HPr family phosphocarrier protein [Betaproteobacteria bacterium]|nr:HPr family phosphocarrier protein [Betaproteobacteria bacterium]
MSEANSVCSSALTRTVRAASTLHARPAAHLVQAVQSFDAKLVLLRGKTRADAKSILDILALSIQEGDWLVLEASGTDAGAALEVLAGLFTSGFKG